MVITTSVVTGTQLKATDLPKSGPLRSARAKSDIVSDLIKIIELEYNKGNRTVTQEKYQAFLKLRERQLTQSKDSETESPPPRPAPLDPPLFLKSKLPSKSGPEKKRTETRRRPQTPWSFKRIETTLIAVLEFVASVLDNLHLLSKMPMFPRSLIHLLNNTNRIWVLILVFLTRKTIQQLLNVGRKERKIASELAILKGGANSKLLEQDTRNDEDTIFRKYEKVLKDLKFDKTMLKIELLGNLLDLAFNMIELYAVPVPGWFMGMLNFASMGMTVYRMNKDGEYVDDDVTEDLI